MAGAPGAGRTPTLDGLRGIAVIAVVLQHAWPSILPGGFAGVDVFFVLSGYLITRMVVSELEATGRIDLVAFYARRVRRIVPAALACVTIVTIVFTVGLGVGLQPDFRLEALGSTLAFSNILFALRATDYFATDPSGSPFLHFWSLGVEEQFYLLWPTALLLLVAAGAWLARRAGPSRLSARRASRWWPLGLALVGAAISFLLANRGSQTTAFFLLPQRAWELLAGGLLAWLQREVGRPYAPGRGVGGWLLAVGGAVALAVTFAFAPGLGRWPGPATALPVLGTVALIAGGQEMPGARPLSNAGLRFFGRISYALYLWHWPALAAVALIALPAAQPPLWLTVVAVAAAIAIATASTVLLEEPIRFSRGRWLTGTRALSAAAGAALVTVALVVGLTAAPPAVAAGPDRSVTIPSAGTPGASSIPAGTGLPGSAASTPPSIPPGTIADLRAQMATIRDDRERLIADACYTPLGKSDVRDCVYGAAANADGSPRHGSPPHGMPVVVLFGDSHAMHWFTAVNAWARGAGFALVPLTRSGCVITDAPPTTSDDNVSGCLDWRVAALARLAALHPAVTVAASSSGVPLTIDGTNVLPRANPGPWVAPTERFLGLLASRSGLVVYIADVPRPGFDVPDCLAAHAGDPGRCAVPLDAANPPALVAAERQIALDLGISFVDPAPWICPDQACPWILNGRIAYVDDHHIAASTSLALEPLLAPALDHAARGVVDPP